MDKRPYLAPLNGLRFLAAFVVFFQHWRVHSSGQNWLPFDWFPFGHAVSFFFVLSGFVLTYVYLDRLNRDNIHTFIVTRIARLWPLHLTTLIIKFMVAGMVATELVSNWDYLRLTLNALMLHSWTFSYRWAMSFNGVSWSVSTEFAFYWVFPILLLCSQTRFRKYFLLIVVGTIVLLAILQMSDTGEHVSSRVSLLTVVHVNPLSRLLEFATGMLFARLYLRRRPKSRGFWMDSFLELALIGALLIVWTTSRAIQLEVIDLPGFGRVWAAWYRRSGGFLLYGLAIYLFAFSGGMLSRVLGCKLCVYMGDTIYAFYLIHNVILRGYEHLLEKPEPQILIGLCCLAMSLAAAIVLHQAVEKPARNALIKMSGTHWRERFQIAWSGIKASLVSIRPGTIAFWALLTVAAAAIGLRLASIS